MAQVRTDTKYWGNEVVVLAASDTSGTLKLEKKCKHSRINSHYNLQTQQRTEVGAKGRSKATLALLYIYRHTYTFKHTHQNIHFKAQMCLQFYTQAHYRGETGGVCCQDIIKTKSQTPLGISEFDQSKTLLWVRITFQILKLMNSLYSLMKSSAANEVDSVLVLFTTQSKNNIVTLLRYKAEWQPDTEKREMISQSICCPA